MTKFLSIACVIWSALGISFVTAHADNDAIDAPLRELPGEREFLSDVDRAHLMYLPKLSSEPPPIRALRLWVPPAKTTTVMTPTTLPVTQTSIQQMQEWIEKQAIAGVVANATESRMIFNGKMYVIGTELKSKYGLRWTGIDPHTKTLYFKDQKEQLIARRY